MTLDEILVEMKKAENICILSHENPDGDAVGSCLGIFHILKNMGKNPVVLIKNFPDTYKFLPGADMVEKKSEIEKFDLAIVVDCPDIKRVNSELIKYFENAKVKIEFDHHMNNTMFADYCVVDHVSPACCQILINSMDYLEVEMSKDVITCFLCGIITDTGGFKNSNTNVQTFEITERALNEGINLPKLYRQSLLMISRTRFEAQKVAMDRMEFFADGKICYTYITNEDFKNLGLKHGDHEGIVEIGRNIEGVEVSIFLHEEEKGYKISLRSNEYVNVAEVCMVFGGGGHIRAAGANTTMTRDEAKNALIREIEKNLK